MGSGHETIPHMPELCTHPKPEVGVVRGWGPRALYHPAQACSIHVELLDAYTLATTISFD